MSVTPFRVLFVDDDEQVLKALKRLLEELPVGYEFEFCSRPADVIELMRQHPTDVVISDMQMPGMTGAELLARVRLAHPAAVRVILSGQATVSASLASANSAHQFLSKPCGFEELLQTLEQGQVLSKLIADASLRAQVSKLPVLPSLPGAYVELMRELKSPDVSIDRVASIISGDVAMAAKTLQMVNSSFFGLPQTVSTVGQAVAFLGLDVLKALVLSAGAFESLQIDSSRGFCLETFQAHSLQAAAIAKSTVLRLGGTPLDSERAYLAGLLHDIGRLVIAWGLSDAQAKVLAGMGDGTSSWASEQRVLGTSHAELGAYLLGLWGLDAEIVEAIAFHHEPRPASSGEYSLSEIVCFASTLSFARATVQFPDELADTFFIQILLEANSVTALMQERFTGWMTLVETVREAA